MITIQSSDQLHKLSGELAAQAKGIERRVFVCAGTACVANGSLDVYAALEEAARKSKVDVDLALTSDGSKTKRLLSMSGCHGFCQMGPLVYIMPDDILYVKVKPADAADIVEQTFKNGAVIKRLLFHDKMQEKKPKQVTRYRGRSDIPFYTVQQRLILERCGEIDPESFEDFLAHGGFTGLQRALFELSPEEVIDEIEQSGLRGRGGAGFSTGKKWRICAENSGAPRSVICNGDEGDPGAFMDRSVMEGDPFQVVEGMAIAGYAVGADRGRIYVRAEYPLALDRITKAIDACRERGLLGSSILGSDFSFDIDITRGGGAFVCGEESALIESIEGRRGMPAPRPPYPAERGLWGGPTVINNVETLSAASRIAARGAEWFKGFGTQSSPGTKTFSIVGKVVNTGLIEVPMGVTLRQVVFDIGGGILNGHEFKAVQTGGPSGGCIPATELDLPIDFDSLNAAGSMMGSGGLIVMDDRTCMVDIARYFTHFLVEESCGKCVPCREGLPQLEQLLIDICQGRGTPEHLSRIKKLAEGIQLGSLCGLGKTAANPVLSTMRYFEDEYRAHVDDKQCPAGVCPDLITYRVVEEDCTSCGVCKKACPYDAIEGDKKSIYRILQDKCTRCGSCIEACRFNAIEVLPGRPPRPDAVGKRLFGPHARKDGQDDAGE